MKGKYKHIETNFIEGKNTIDPDDLFFDDDGALPLKHFDVSNFFEDPSRKNDHLIGMAMCAMIETYNYPITFFMLFYFYNVFTYSYL